MNGAHLSKVKANHVGKKATGATTGQLTVSSQSRGEVGQKRSIVYSRNSIGLEIIGQTGHSPKKRTFWGIIRHVAELSVPLVILTKVKANPC